MPREYLFRGIPETELRGDPGLSFVGVSAEKGSQL